MVHCSDLTSGETVSRNIIVRQLPAVTPLDLLQCLCQGHAYPRLLLANSWTYWGMKAMPSCLMPPTVGNLCSRTSHQPGQDCLRTTLQAEAPFPQSSCLLSCLSLFPFTMSDPHCGQRVLLSCFWSLTCLSSIGVSPNTFLAHLVLPWHLYLWGTEQIQKSSSNVRKPETHWLLNCWQI